MPIVPDYASVSGPRIARGLYGWVLFCAIAPMVTGVGILLLYVITRSEELPIAGFFFLGIGFVVVLVGAVLLVWYRSQQRRANLLEPVVLRKRVRLATILLLANILLAAACVYLGMREMSRQVFVFTNASGDSLTAVDLTFPDGRKIDFGAVVPGQSVRRFARITTPWSEAAAKLHVVNSYGGGIQEKLNLSEVSPYRSQTTGIAFSGEVATRVYTGPSD